MLKSARLSLALAKAELSRAMGAKQAAADAAEGDFGEMGRGGITAGHKQFNAATEKAQKAQADVDAAQKTVDGYQEAINTISAGLNAPEFKPAAAAVKAKSRRAPPPPRSRPSTKRRWRAFSRRSCRRSSTSPPIARTGRRSAGRS
jgi:hypothetical protein